MKNKPDYGIDLVNGWQLRCVKNKWYWLKDSMPLYKELCVSIVCIAISHMNNIFQARLKNTYKKFIYDKQYDGFMEWFTGLENYDHALYYNKATGAFAWKRSIDLYLGCNDKLFTDEFVTKFELKPKYERYEE